MTNQTLCESHAEGAFAHAVLASMLVDGTQFSYHLAACSDYADRIIALRTAEAWPKEEDREIRKFQKLCGA